MRTRCWIGTWMVVFVLAWGTTSAAQGRRGQGSSSSSGPGGSSEREASAYLPSGLAFPRGLESFDGLPLARPITRLAGWESHTSRPGLFSACAADDVLGVRTPGSGRWLRVRDLSPTDATHAFSTPPLDTPRARDYSWSLRLNVEALGPGPVHPALVSQHLGPLGYDDLFGVELGAAGLDLIVRALGGDERRARLVDWTGPAAFGSWLALDLSVDFDRGLVRGAVAGLASATLPLAPRPGTRLDRLRFAYRGEGAGNAGVVLLDDLALAFGASVCEEVLTLGFETEDDRATPLVNGQDLSTPPEFGTLFALSSSGANAGAAIFDSTPGGPNDPSQDRDLLVGLGNLVILQTNQNTTQSVPGVFDRPNDDGDGGTLTFDFTRPLEVLALDLVDIDRDPQQSASVRLTDGAGRLRVYSVPAGFTEDVLDDGGPGYRTLDTTTLLPQPGFLAAATALEDAGFDPGDVVRLEVQLGSSGALDNLALRVPCVRLDFETEDDGVTALVNGQDVSTPPEFGQHVSITSSGPNAGAAIFDSTPGGPNDPSQDLDLLVGLGNLLILQGNDAASTLLQTVPGIFDRPNDDSDGGTLAFTFAVPVQPRQLDLVDIDPGATNSSAVVLFDTLGRARTFSVPPGFTEDLPTHGGAGFRTLDLRQLLPQAGFSAAATASEDPGFDENTVTRVEVRLGSSGAVDNFCFCP